MLDEWLATFAFSRAVRHAPRDFSDAVLLAELLAQALPAGAVALHNYPSTGRLQQKLVNWELLNRKVLTPMRCELSRFQIEELANASPGAITRLLVRVKQTIERGQRSTHNSSEKNATFHRAQIPPAASIVAKVLASPTSIASKKYVSDCGTSKTTSQSPTSISRSTPSSPHKARARHPARRQYSLMDYLPSSSERPTPEDVSSTFSRVLQMTEARSTPKSFASQSPKRHLCAVESVSPLPNRSVYGKESPQLKDNKTISIRSSMRAGTPSNTVSVSPTSWLQKDHDFPNGPVLPTKFAEGAFVRFEMTSKTSVEKVIHLARVARLLSSGDYLLQLCKPSAMQIDKSISSSSTCGFVSTPYFIECSSVQMHSVSGAAFDATRGVWTLPNEQDFFIPNQTAVSSSSRGAAVTVLERHKFSNVRIDAPLELRIVEPGVGIVEVPDNFLPIYPQSCNGERKFDLFPPPTVFPAIQVDITTALETRPTAAYIAIKSNFQ